MTRAPVSLPAIGDNESNILSKLNLWLALMYQASSGSIKDVIFEDNSPFNYICKINDKFKIKL